MPGVLAELSIDVDTKTACWTMTKCLDTTKPDDLVPKTPHAPVVVSKQPSLGRVSWNHGRRPLDW